MEQGVIVLTHKSAERPTPGAVRPDFYFSALLERFTDRVVAVERIDNSQVQLVATGEPPSF